MRHQPDARLSQNPLGAFENRGLIRFARPLTIAILPLLLATGAVWAQDIVVREFRIPMPEAGEKGLQAVMVRPHEPGPHPLALITHGTPIGDPGARVKINALSIVPVAREFARRGWAAVFVMRRGFGDSGGEYVESRGGCSYFGDLTAGQEAVKDLHAAVAYLSTLPEIDASRMISVGQSTGGFAVVALAADPPPGLVAAINFAGGRGAFGDNKVCDEDGLVEAFAHFGKTSRIPMLWVYTENDKKFGPDLARRLYQNFTSAGGDAKFVLGPPFGEDGHYLFSPGGIPIWTPLVDDFLKNQNLVLRETPLPLTVPDVEPPSQLGAQGRDWFRTYLLAAPHKAFAVSSNGAYGFSVSRRTTEDAELTALENCEKHAQPPGTCVIAVVDDEKPPD
jgi:dienelactone hydrolase